jgi:hypothetical protein
VSFARFLHHYQRRSQAPALRIAAAAGAGARAAALALALAAAGGRENQLRRLAAHDARLTPAKRQFYGTPNPMPDFLVGTNIGGAKTAAALPLMGFFGDSVTLGLAGPLLRVFLMVFDGCLTVRMKRDCDRMRFESDESLSKQVLGQERLLGFASK